MRHTAILLGALLIAGTASAQHLHRIHNAAMGKCLIQRAENMRHYHEPTSIPDNNKMEVMGFARKYLLECYEQEKSHITRYMDQCHSSSNRKIIELDWEGVVPENPSIYRTNPSTAHAVCQDMGLDLYLKNEPLYDWGNFLWKDQVRTCQRDSFHDDPKITVDGIARVEEVKKHTIFDAQHFEANRDDDPETTTTETHITSPLPKNYDHLIHNAAKGRCMLLRANNMQHYHHTTSNFDRSGKHVEGFAKTYLEVCMTINKEYLGTGLQDCYSDSRTRCDHEPKIYNNRDAAAAYCMDQKIKSFIQTGSYPTRYKWGTGWTRTEWMGARGN